MKKIKKILASLMVVIMLLSFAPLAELVGLDFGLKAEAAGYKTGDIITFGSYPQSKVEDVTLRAKLGEITLDSNGDVTFNGVKYKRYVSSNVTDFYRYDPIEWRVLSTGYDGIYVLAEKILDCQSYHKTKTSITWADCALRTWLNTTFYNMAFSSSEKEKIRTSILINDSNSFHGTNGGIDTKDKIFIPSYYDIMTHDPNLITEKTEYANSVYNNDDYNYKYYISNCWWLRTPGGYDYEASCVGKDGNIYGIAHYGVGLVDISSYGVRPALKLNLQSSIYQSEAYNSYSLTAVDCTTTKPVANATVIFDGEAVGTTGADGTYTLRVGNNEDPAKEVKIIKSGYTDESRCLYELNPYASNRIQMQGGAGIDVSKMLANMAFNGEKIYGPTVSFLGQSFPLFSFDAGLDLGSVSLECKHNTEKKTVEYIIGLGEDVQIKSEGDFYKNYNDFKEFFNCFSNGANWRAYNKIQDKLQKSGGKLGFKAELSTAGYLEFDYSSGELKLKEGGMVVVAAASVTEDVPWGGIAYGTFTIGGEIEGKLYATMINSGNIGMETSLGISLKPSIGVGAKLLSKKLASVEAGIKGKINGKFVLPADSFRDCFSATLSANVYIKAKALWVFENEWTSNFPAMELYPNTGQFQTSSVVDLDELPFKVMARDYNLKDFGINPDYGSFVTSSVETTVDLYNTYSEGKPKLVRLDDGRMIVVWAHDDGSKSSLNRTTMYYSIYSDGLWTTPTPVFESGCAEFEPVICTNGMEIFAVWQRATQTFDDNETIENMLANVELVYAHFDGNTWSQPEIVGNSGNGIYPYAYSIAENNGEVAIAWAENSENDYMNNSGYDTIYMQSMAEGVWGSVHSIAQPKNFNSLAVGFSGGSACVAYSDDLDGDIETSGDREIYIGSSQLTSNEVDDIAVTYQNGEFYFVSDGYLSTADSTSNLQVEGDYSVITNGQVTAVVYPVVDGYNSELYVAYESAGDYTSPVQLTNTGKYIPYYSAVLDSDNTIVCAMNVRNLSGRLTGSPYTTTNFVVDNIGSAADLEIDEKVIYDLEAVSAGNDLTFASEIKNIGTADVSEYTINLKDSTGKTVLSRLFNSTIKSGQTVKANLVYTLPTDFSKQTYTITVEGSGDLNTGNDSAQVTVGHADINIVSALIEENTINVTVVNNGYETITGAKADFNRFVDDSTLLGTVAIGQLLPGEIKTISYMIPKTHREFDSPYSVNKFTVTVSSDNEEQIMINNSTDVILKPKAVESISLGTTQTTIEIGSTLKLVATFSPSDAFNTGVHWVSDSTNVADVDENGIVTAISGGTAIITAITDDGGLVAQCEVTVSVAVSGVKMSQGEADLTVGNTVQLIADVTPDGASNKNVQWISSDENIAKVTDNGVVTGIKTGSATITVTTDDGGFTDTCIVRVTNPVRGISLNETSMKIYNGTSKQLYATINPIDADVKDIIWTSSDDTIATVDDNGIVTAANSTGTAVIKATTVDGGYYATCTVKTGKQVTDVYISDSTLNLVPGLTHQLTATVIPLKALNQKVYWASTNESVATVDDNGIVNAHKAGSAVIIVETDDGNYTKTCNVIVTNSTSGFVLNSHDEYIPVNGVIQLEGTFTPADAENKALEWTTSDPSIATVTQNGLVTGKKAGSVVVTATTVDGGYRDYCIVRVVGITANINTATVVDAENGYIFGVNAGLNSLDEYVTLSDVSCSLEYATAYGEIGTGTVTNLVRDDSIIDSYTVVIFGDVNGDGWYDGQDAVIVSCLANGMLTKDDVSEAVYMAADCNHDGVIDQLDVALLNQAGTLLANVDQSKPAEILLETSSEYVEYLDLIDQSPELDIEDETDAPEADAETEDTTPEQDAKVNIFEMIMNFIKSIFEILFAYIPVPYK